MRPFLTLLLLALPLSAEKVTFDGGRFSVEFPEGWKEADPPQQDIKVHRESADGEAAFSISLMGIAKGSRADLDATLKAFVKNFAAGGMTVKGDPKGQPSTIDGKKALVATVPVEIKAQGELMGITFFMVLVEAPERLIVMQATLSGSGTNEQRADCRKIIGSFEEREAEDDKTEDDEAQNDEDAGE